MDDVLDRLDRIAEALTAPPREYLDIDGAAAFIGVSRQTVDKWRMDRQGPAYIKVGKQRVMYSVEDLRSFMTSLKVRPLQ